MNFVNVQIPYRGLIPIINKRGPLASVELEESLAKMLHFEYGVPMLDPFNGKDFVFEDVIENPVDEEITTGEEIPTAEEPEVAPVEEPAPEVAEEKVEDDVPVEEEPKVVEDTTESTETAEFDYTAIANYSTLSKSKKKELRAYYAANVTQVDRETLYATLNQMAAE